MAFMIPDLPFSTEKLVSVIVTDHYVEVTWRTESNSMLLTYPPKQVPDHIHRVVFTIHDGKLIETERQIGQINLIPKREEIVWENTQTTQIL